MKKTFTGWIWKSRIKEVGSKENRGWRRPFYYMPTVYQKNDERDGSIKVKVTVETVVK